MTRDELVRLRADAWKRLASLLHSSEQPSGTRKIGPDGISELATLYRSLASDLMQVRRDRLGADLERHLDSLASRAHNVLYAGTSVGTKLRFRSLLLDFAPAVRRNLRFVVVACVLFFGTGIAAGIAAYVDESYALAVMSSDQLEGMEKMYEKGHDGRAADLSAGMTGFYVLNNVGIAFRCFGTGILFGLGPIFYLLFNGLNMGVVFGHLARSGQGEHLFSFVSTHAPWELTAIALAGAAGMQMGFALVQTNGRTRLGNLRAHGLELLRQVAGAAAFLLLAAVIEAWYSPSALPVMVKYISGIVGWIMVVGLLAFAGRDRPLPADVRELISAAGPIGPRSLFARRGRSK